MRKIFLFLVLTISFFANSIKLYHGWNMVGISSNIDEVSQLFSQHTDISTVWTYDNSAKVWKVFQNRTQSNSTYQTFSSLKQKDAIWIYNKGQDLTVTIPDSSSNIATSIYNGWNLVGMDLDNFSIVDFSNRNGELTSWWSYDNMLKVWSHYGVENFDYKSLTSLTKNQAVWILNSSDKTLTTDFTITENNSAVENRKIKVDGDYLLIAWNDLGMHCMDENYSVFSILPPFNNLRATLIKKGGEPHLQNDEIKVTYQSAVNLDGTVNTESSTKTDFWKHSKALFQAELEENVGLTGNRTPSNTPQTIPNPTEKSGLMEVSGIPLTPYNDDGSKNYYQLVDVVAQNSAGEVVALTKAVLPVSDEMDCKKCHQSNSNWTEAKPTNGWENATNITEDYKLNILKKHDDEHYIVGYVEKLKEKGYNYQSSLYETAKAGTPILCASCHKSNALKTEGFDTIPPLTTAIHKVHSEVKDMNGIKLNDSTNKNSCYSCHPGSETDCLRGAMGSEDDISCQNCHGKLSNVSNPQRHGWIDEPSCQSCHQNGKREESVFKDDTFTTLRDIVDTKFATNQTATGEFKLYKDSVGHGDLSCQACHGSQHSIYPSLKAEDNLQSQAIQGHNGTISNCVACHKTVPNTINEGPHGMHSTSQWWVEEHGDIVEDNSGAIENCKKCHGADLKGSDLAETFQDRVFDAEEFGTKTYSKGAKVTCFDCHKSLEEEEDEDEEEDDDEKDDDDD